MCACLLIIHSRDCVSCVFRSLNPKSLNFAHRGLPFLGFFKSITPENGGSLLCFMLLVCCVMARRLVHGASFILWRKCMASRIFVWLVNRTKFFRPILSAVETKIPSFCCQIHRTKMRPLAHILKDATVVSYFLRYLRYSVFSYNTQENFHARPGKFDICLSHIKNKASSCHFYTAGDKTGFFWMPRGNADAFVTLCFFVFFFFPLVW